MKRSHHIIIFRCRNKYCKNGKGNVNMAIAVHKTAKEVLFSANSNDIVLYISED